MLENLGLHVVLKFYLTRGELMITSKYLLTLNYLFLAPIVKWNDDLWLVKVNFGIKGQFYKN